MKWDVNILQDEIEKLLLDSGFVPELYQIKIEDDCVCVFFDKKAAVDYFETDFNNSKLIKNCVFEYKRFGKKHAACIYYW